MRSLLYLLLAGGAAMLAGACSSGSDTGRNPAARALYEKSLSLTRLYTDSLLMAKDSATVERLSQEYDEALTKLNFSYPADTGLEISEGENDTLSNMTLRYVALRDSLLYRFGHPLVLAPDSIAADSVRNDSIN